MALSDFRPLIGPSNYGVPNRSARCLCGSGERFKNCCAGRWRDPNYRDGYRKAAERKDFQDAVDRLRADITWYRICHERHTKVLLKAGADLGNEILAIDIDALFALASTMLSYLGELGETEGAREFAEFCRSFSSDERWQEKSDLLAILAALGPAWDERKAKDVVKGFGDLERYTDPEILMVIIDVMGDELSFAKSYRLAHRVLEQTNDPYYRLHYGLLCATLLLRVSDRSGATERLSEVLKEFEFAMRDLDSASAYELFQLIQAMSLAEMLLPEGGYGQRGIIACNKLLDSGDLNASGLSRAYRVKGELLRSQEDLGGAIQCFRRAHAESSDFVSVVLEAECEAMRGDLRRAVSLLGTVSLEDLDEAGNADFAFVSARCALALRDVTLLRSALVRLRALKLTDSLFETQRNDLAHEIELAIIRPPSPETVDGPKMRFLELFSRYVELKPNISGVGFNINALLEDLAEKRAKRIARLDPKPDNYEERSE